jgi:O-antigen/teichoic acid export membrane protein
LVDFGADTNVLRHQHLTTNLIDSAWSLRILQGWIVALALAVIAPFAGGYFQQEKVVPIIWVISGALLLTSFTNIGMTVARKEFQFGLEYRFNVYSKILGVAVTLAAAYFLRDYRALVIGIVTGSLSRLVLSYLMHPHRPRWNTSEIRSMWHFSKWLLVSGIGRYATKNADQIIAGRIGDAHTLGVYHVAADIGQMPTGELGPPIMRAFLPTLSAMKDNRGRVSAAVLKTFSAVNTLTLAVGLGFFAVSELLTTVLLGAKWTEATPYLAIFALVGTIRTSVTPFQGMLLLEGKSKTHAYLMWVELAAFLVAAALLTPHYGIIGLAYARLFSVFAFMVSSIRTAHLQLGILYERIFQSIWRPLVCAILMVVLLRYVPEAFEQDFLNLIVKIIVGGIFYLSAILLTWQIAGKPDGIEEMARSAAIATWKKLVSRQQQR